MNTKLEQVTALSTGLRTAQSITLPDFPTLEGPRADQVQRFNEQMKEWKRKAEIRLSEQMTTPQVG